MRGQLAILLLTAVAVCLGVQAQNATQPAPQAPSAASADPAARPAKPADRMDQYIKTIESAQDPLVAAAAYARGLAIDPNNVSLHDAYMRRQLQLGFVELAYQPALALMKLDDSSGLAWAVMAQMQAKGLDYLDALQSIVKAAQKAPNDPFVRARAAELLAWHEQAGKLPGVSDALHKELAAARARLAGNQEFARAYDEAKGALARVRTENGNAPTTQPQTTAQRVQQLTAEVARLRQQIDTMRRQQRGNIRVAQAPTPLPANPQIYLPPAVPPPQYPTPFPPPVITPPNPQMYSLYPYGYNRNLPPLLSVPGRVGGEGERSSGGERD